MKIDTFETFYESYLEFKHYVSSKFENCCNNTSDPSQTIEKQESLEKKVEILENEIESLRNINKNLKDEAENYLRIIESLMEDKNNDTTWQTQSRRNTKSNKSADNNRKEERNSLLPLRNLYEVLQVDENDEVENENEHPVEKRRITERSNTKTHSGRNNRFGKKVSGEWFLHTKEMNGNPIIVPGNRSYAETTKYGKKVIVFGDSHLARINRKLFNDSLQHCRSRLKYFSGAKTKDLEHYVTPTLNEEEPDIVVIHIGSNDIDFRKLRQNTVENIGNDIINIGKKCREFGVSKVIISSVLVKNNMKLTKFIRQLNDILRNLCSVNGFCFISNDNITKDFISQDGVHLNKDGTCILAGNFVDFINSINHF